LLSFTTQSPHPLTYQKINSKSDLFISKWGANSCHEYSSTLLFILPNTIATEIKRMGFRELEEQRIKKIVGEYCDGKIPEHIRNQIRLFYKIRGNNVSIIESRPHFIKKDEWTESPIARMRFDSESMNWQLFWRRANGRWQKYTHFKPTKSLQALIDEIEKDPWYVFWG
jgi:Txe/YoeB family toxin of Txe-Axe toxin-antitoxin module